MSARISRTAYLTVFFLLMALLGLTIWASYWPYEEWGWRGLGVLVAMLIASAKMFLVVLYFMHVRHSARLTKIFVAAGVLWLLILFVLSFNDYLTRGWLPVSQGWKEEAVLPRP